MHVKDEGGNPDIAQALQALIIAVAKAMVDREDQVEAEIVRKETGTVLVLGVAPEDIVKFFGEHERLARSLRAIMVAAGRKNSQQLSLKFGNVADEAETFQRRLPPSQSLRGEGVRLRPSPGACLQLDADNLRHPVQGGRLSLDDF